MRGPVFDFPFSGLRNKFKSRADKTIAKGEKNGCSDPGFDVPQMGDDLVDDFKILTDGNEEAM